MNNSSVFYILLKVWWVIFLHCCSNTTLCVTSAMHSSPVVGLIMTNDYKGMVSKRNKKVEFSTFGSGPSPLKIPLYIFYFLEAFPITMAKKLKWFISDTFSRPMSLVSKIRQQQPQLHFVETPSESKQLPKTSQVFLCVKYLTESLNKCNNI